MNEVEFEAHRKKRYLEKMVAKYGSLEAYKEEMVRRRSLVKNLQGFHTMDKEKHAKIAKMGNKASHEAKAKRSSPKSKE